MERRSKTGGIRETIESHFTRKRRDDYYPRIALGRQTHWTHCSRLAAISEGARAGALAPRRFSTLDPTARANLFRLDGSNISTNTRRSRLSRGTRLPTSPSCPSPLLASSGTRHCRKRVRAYERAPGLERTCSPTSSCNWQPCHSWRRSPPLLPFYANFVFKLADEAILPPVHGARNQRVCFFVSRVSILEGLAWFQQ